MFFNTTLRGANAFGFLKTVGKQEHPYEFLAEEPDGNHLRLWIDGGDTQHVVVLNADGSWELRTGIEI